MDRIRSLEPTGTTFHRPEAFDPAAEADRPLYRPGAQDRLVILDLAPDAAWVAEVTPHDRVDSKRGGWIRLTLRTGPSAWLERLVLQLGESVKVVEPESLRDAASALATAALARYA